ncbi:MAG: hypothetical protein V5B40_08820 [Candidatus Accumulibacter meliphilus]|jgi:hypothetical protein|uniref:hypothetical protein n=1 Tax=Candidatus Accumulibacter meliphilus TaxID=2211374 RepID=UPI002FC2CC01
MIANIRKGLDEVLAAAPQLPKASRWPALVRYIVSKILAAWPKNAKPPSCSRIGANPSLR